jgi:hypothetical protein
VVVLECVVVLGCGEVGVWWCWSVWSLQKIPEGEEKKRVWDTSLDPKSGELFATSAGSSLRLICQPLLRSRAEQTILGLRTLFLDILRQLGMGMEFR